MEFFESIDTAISGEALQQMLGIDKLTAYCASIDKVLWSDAEQGEIYCLWGQFTVHREPIRDGVRFTLPNCPNALAWTITGNPSPLRAGITIHCVINRVEHDPDFVESIHEFVADWRDGLLKAAAALQGQPAALSGI